jgi:hypothetical protein
LLYEAPDAMRPGSATSPVSDSISVIFYLLLFSCFSLCLFDNGSLTGESIRSSLQAVQRRFRYDWQCRAVFAPAPV